MYSFSVPISMFLKVILIWVAVCLLFVALFAVTGFISYGLMLLGRKLGLRSPLVIMRERARINLVMSLYGEHMHSETESFLALEWTVSSPEVDGGS